MQYSEDEQVEKLKVWWKSYGNALIVGVVIGLAILYGGRYWNQLQREKAAQASSLFDQLTYYVEKKDKKNVDAIGAKIVDEYARTPYAGLAALLIARQNLDANDKAKAKAQLAWAMENAREENVRHVAMLRLARVQLDEKNIQGAEELVKAGAPVGFELEYYELLGDIEKQKNNRTAARQAYEKALSHASGARNYADVIRMKLDELG